MCVYFIVFFNFLKIYIPILANSYVINTLIHIEDIIFGKILLWFE